MSVSAKLADAVRTGRGSWAVEILWFWWWTFEVFGGEVKDLLEEFVAGRLVVSTVGFGVESEEGLDESQKLMFVLWLERTRGGCEVDRWIVFGFIVWDRGREQRWGTQGGRTGCFFALVVLVGFGMRVVKVAVGAFVDGWFGSGVVFVELWINF